MYTHDSFVVASSGPAAWLGLRHHLASIFPPRPYEKKIIKKGKSRLYFLPQIHHTACTTTMLLSEKGDEKSVWKLKGGRNHPAPTHHHLYIEASIAGGTSACLLPISMPRSTDRSTVAIIEFSPIPSAFLQHIAAGAGVVRWCRREPEQPPPPPPPPPRRRRRRRPNPIICSTSSPTTSPLSSLTLLLPAHFLTFSARGRSKALSSPSDVEVTAE